MEKMRRFSKPLKDFTGTTPFRGVVTGLNEAFLLDSKAKNAIVQCDPKSGDIIRPFLRGQATGRWVPEWDGWWMIFARRGIDIDQYPGAKKHLLTYREKLEPKPDSYQGSNWPGRKPGHYHWYEIQDPVEYWREFSKPKICYQDIAWFPRFCLDTKGMLANNTVHFLPTHDCWILAALNSPIAWWYAWRNAQHGKDEALRLFTTFMEGFPIPLPTDEQRRQTVHVVTKLIDIVEQQRAGRCAVLDWLKVEFDVEKPSQKLQDLASLDTEVLVTEIKKARGRNRPLTIAGLKALKEEHARSILPLQALAAEARHLEREVAELVNAAYGLTPDEIALMWKTAPPRMPGGQGSVAINANG
jgi:hypothetical protein